MPSARPKSTTLPLRCEAQVTDRRTFLKTAGLTAASLAVTGCSQPSLLSRPNKPAKTNVLLIGVDDLRPQLSCYGHHRMVSPNIDRLASRGTLFRRAYCQVPVCGPSRASLLTGLRPTKNRFRKWNASVDRAVPGVLSLPEHFKNHGYHTISNGKVFHHHDACLRAWSEPPWHHPRSNLRRGLIYKSKASLELIKMNEKLGKEGWREPGPPCEAANVPASEYPDGMIADKSLNDLERLRQMHKPFFLAVGFLKPHLPFNAPTKYWQLYQRENIDLADNPFRPRGAPDAALHNWGELRSYVNVPRNGPLPEKLARKLIHGYYACVSFIDAQIGRLLERLEALGLAENTVVLLWGDHGWQLGEHGLWCKHCNFETSLHSPLIVKAPGFAEEQKSSALTEYMDIYPTLCELCRLPVPPHVQGTSFVPCMKKPTRDWKKAALSRYNDADSIRTHRYRYTQWSDDKGHIYAEMLFDHKLDPNENTNIATLPQNAKLVANLRRMIRKGYRCALPG